MYSDSGDIVQEKNDLPVPAGHSPELSDFQRDEETLTLSGLVKGLYTTATTMTTIGFFHPNIIFFSYLGF